MNSPLSAEGLSGVSNEGLGGLAAVADGDLAEEVQLALRRELDVHHLLPHVPGTGLAELDLQTKGNVTWLRQRGIALSVM